MLDLDLDVKASIALLASFSLIKRTRHDSFMIHPVVHTWARERLQISEKEEVIEMLLPVLDTRQDRQKWFRI